MFRILGILILTIALTGCMSYTENIHETSKKAVNDAQGILDDANKRIDNIEYINEDEVTLKANQLLNEYPYSKKEIYDILTVDINSETAKNATDNMENDWNITAVDRAELYARGITYSDSELHAKLTHAGFTSKQADYAIQNMR